MTDAVAKVGTGTPVVEPTPASRLIDVMRRCSAVVKGRKNAEQNFQYRGVDDVFNELHQHCAAAGIMPRIELVEHTLTERISNKGSKYLHHLLRCRIGWLAEDGQTTEPVLWIGEAADYGDKGIGKAQQYALKMFLLEHFMVPTSEGLDPDAQSFEIGPAGRGAQPDRNAQANRRPPAKQLPVRPDAPSAGAARPDAARPAPVMREAADVYEENRRAVLAVKTLEELTEFRYFGSKHLGAEQIQALRQLRESRKRELEQAAQQRPGAELADLFTNVNKVNPARATEIMRSTEQTDERIRLLRAEMEAWHSRLPTALKDDYEGKQ